MKKMLLFLITSCLIYSQDQGRFRMDQHFRVKSIKIDKANNLKENSFFAKYGKILGINHDTEMKKQSVIDEEKQTHTRYTQYYKGLEVLGADYILHEEDGKVNFANGGIVPNLKMDISPGITESMAFDFAIEHLNAKRFKWETEPELFEKPSGQLAISAKNSVFKNDNMHLVYRFDIYSEEPLARYIVEVDAKSGEIINKYNRIHTGNVAATGTSSYNGTVNFTADNTGSNYRLRQTSMGSGVETYSLNNGTSYSSATDVTSSSSHFTSDNVAVQAHYGAEQTYQYFFQKHGRNSYNGSGAKLLSYVHYSNNYVNAFWDGSRMTYGDGNGTTYGPLVSLDIAAHEMAHGVTEFSANLVYQKEEGALNESFSDIFGEAVENFATGSNDWLMGDDIGIGRSGAIRSMSNPNQFNDPDTYHGTHWANTNVVPSRANDYGGVHTNSGVQNFWFYILTTGKSGTNDNGDNYSVTAIGIEKAAKIAYRNLTIYLSRNSQYSDAREGAIRAARDLYGAGSQEEISTTNAWYAVGVGAAYNGGGDRTPPTITAVNASSISNSGASITWTTNEGATSQVEYGLTSSYGSSTTETSNHVTSHSVNLSGLAANTTYNYRVKSKDAAGNSAVSGNLTFTTLNTGGGSNETEPNNSFSTANSIDLNKTIKGYIGSNGDEDYFVFTTSQAGDLHIELANFPGDYDMFLYSNSQSELARAYTLNDPEIIDHSASAAETFYLKVDGYQSAFSSSDDYELKITFTASGGGQQWYKLAVNQESPHPYPNHYNNTYTYSKPGASRVAVRFSRFETESNYDFVHVKDVNNTTVDSYHGTLNAFWSIVNGNEVNVNIVSDYSVRKWGYKIDSVAYYSSSALTEIVNRRRNPKVRLIYKHINAGEKGQEINLFASKEEIPDEIQPNFHAAYPNPFNPTTTIKYNASQSEFAKVEIINLLGQVVNTLFQGKLEAGSTYEFSWNAKSQSGTKVASGIYFYRISTGSKIFSNKLILMK